VRTYPGADEFLADAGQIQPDCVLLDVFMPNCSGLDVLTLIGAPEYPAPIMMISGRSDMPTALTALASGAFDFIEKPIAPQELVASVREAVCAFRAETGRRTT
jgi:FixJ family two-component response regulator